MELRSDATSLTPDSRIELVQIDLTPLGGDVLYFHAGTNQLGTPVIWQGNAYQPGSLEIEGFEQDSQGAVARPRLRIGNISGFISGLLFDYDELKGALVTRKRTTGRYLDAANFPNGNPYADPTQQYPDEVYEIDRVANDDGIVVEFELGAPHDVLNAEIPARVVIDNMCDAIYRSGEICDWTPGSDGPWFDINDQPTTEVNDECSQCLTGCQLRFGNEPLPLGAFLAAGLVR
ncbi:phage minor tail protein L [Hydrocarboniphaga effusa]|uniref:phage minor tail protein L n=1 Tax=Hydrocarboniphaga effusa TaxID=243629 RepID=UPI003BADAA59